MAPFSCTEFRDAATKYGNADDAKPVGRADVCDESAVLLAAAVLPSDTGPDSVPDRPARAKALLCADAGAAAGPDHEPAVLRADVGAIAPRPLLSAHEIADPGATVVIQAHDGRSRAKFCADARAHRHDETDDPEALACTDDSAIAASQVLGCHRQ